LFVNCNGFISKSRMRKRILLTGATGFVGRQILSALQKVDVDLRLVVRDESEHRIQPIKSAEIIRTRDLFEESPEWWAIHCRDVDTVIHAAWYAEPGKYMQSPKNIDCLVGTLRLATACIDAGVRRFVGVGSCAEYDMNGGYLSVDTPLLPSTPYGGAKGAAFMALSTIFPQQGVSFAWARLFYLYGEGEDHRRLASYLHARLSVGETAELGGGEQIRDYLDVVTAGAEIAVLALSEKVGAVNICSGQGQTVREFAERIADIYERRDLLRFGVRKDNPFDPPCVVGVRS
jgi:dTDP-6-deoxy-L-talose 4-dehydrogenase (NAD+)